MKAADMPIAARNLCGLSNLRSVAGLSALQRVASSWTSIGYDTASNRSQRCLYPDARNDQWPGPDLLWLSYSSLRWSWRYSQRLLFRCSAVVRMKRRMLLYAQTSAGFGSLPRARYSLKVHRLRIVAAGCMTASAFDLCWITRITITSDSCWKMLVHERVHLLTGRPRQTD